MKFKTTTDDGQTLNFLRNLNTEKMYREDTGREFNAQLGELAYHLEAMGQAEDKSAEDYDPKKLYALAMDLTFLETRDEVLKYMYAEKNEAGTLIQNEATREAWEELSGLDKNMLIGLYFRRI